MKIFNRKDATIDSLGSIIQIECSIASGCMRCLPDFIGAQVYWGVEIGDRSDGSSDWGLYSWSCWIGFACITALVANTLYGLDGSLKSLTLGGTIDC